ncbi:MAG: gluconate 2-dehydrogenase subunit 3 family protein [Flavobacteriaceae bacterium]|nr:gluconate 2-dehydrogenase subunit 3 family protein [Flavobacteriaceae bacterium]
MNRRDTLKSLILGSVATGLVLNGCSPNASEALPELAKRPLYGRTPSEKLRDEEIYKETFLNEEELSTIAVLCDIILPKNDAYGSASEAGVKEFIDFIVKDMSYQQTPIRGGLMWLNNYSHKLYRQDFKDCSRKQQLTICDQIAYPDKTKPALKQGEKFFTRMRNLTLTGYFTSKMGIKDLGYKGNSPNVWDGVPQEVLDKHGLKYDKKWLAKCVDQDKRDNVAAWDEKGNLIS